MRRTIATSSCLERMAGGSYEYSVLSGWQNNAQPILPLPQVHLLCLMAYGPYDQKREKQRLIRGAHIR